MEIEKSSLPIQYFDPSKISICMLIRYLRFNLINKKIKIKIKNLFTRIGATPV